MLLLMLFAAANQHPALAQNRGRVNADRIILTGDTTTFNDSGWVAVANGTLWYDSSSRNFAFRFRNTTWLLPDSLWKQLTDAASIGFDSSLTVRAPLQVTAYGRILLVSIDPDSLMAYRAQTASADSTKLVSLDRDDASIRGEKTFLGVAGFKFFGQYNLTGGERRAFWASADTATKRTGDTVVSISWYGANAHLFQIYSSGLIDMPKQSAVRAYRSSNVAFAATDSVVYNAEVFDTQSEFNSTTGEFVARIAGTYLVSAHVWLSTSTTYNNIALYLKKNFVSFAFTEDGEYVGGSTYYCSMQLTTLVQLAAGDRLKLHLTTSSSGGTLYGAIDATYISIVKVM